MSIENKPSIIITRLEKSDIDDVDILAQRAYGEHHWSKDAFYSELSNNLAKYYASRTPDGRLTGFAGSWRIIDEAHITTIAVDPDFRRQHIGEALLVAIIEDCYKDMAKYLTLEVRESNMPAIKMYEKYGFKSFGVRKGYYQDNNENALIMWTENIFWDKFKTGYEQNLVKLRELVNIK